MATLKTTSEKCPECGASLPIPPDAMEVRCAYCNTVSRVERGGRKAPTTSIPGQRVVVVRQGASSALLIIILITVVVPFIGLIAGVGFAVQTCASVATRSVTTTINGVTTTIGGVGALPSMGTGDKFQWDGNRQTMLFDVNGDRVQEPIGWIRVTQPGGSTMTAHIAAFDAATGKELWRTANLADVNNSHQAHAAIAGDRLVVADPLGMLHAFVVQTGQPLWTAMVGERVERLCGDVQGWMRIEATDKRALKLNLMTGQLAPGGQVSEYSSCSGVFADKPGITPYNLVMTRFNVWTEPLPELQGMDVEGMVYDSWTQARIALGAKTPGTRVPMIAAYAMPPKEIKTKAFSLLTSNHPKLTPRWLALVPRVDPLKVNEGAPKTAAIAAGRVIVPYKMSDSKAGWRLACFDVNTGANLWDVQVPQSDTSDVASIVASDRQVFASIWTYLHVFDLATGTYRMTIGQW